MADALLKCTTRHVRIFTAISEENNLIEDPYSLASVQKGNLIIRFLNQKNSINYEILDNRINILKLFSCFICFTYFGYT